VDDSKAETTPEQERNPDHDVQTTAYACAKTFRIAVRMPLKNPPATNTCTVAIRNEEQAQGHAGDGHDRGND
jgi:hypothetical protein